MPPTPQPEWVQYGSFGLIAFLVLVGLPGGVYALKLIVNQAFEYHKAIIGGIMDRHCQMEKECREDRNRIADLSESRAEKDRASRHELADAIQKLSGNVDMMLSRSRNS
jgi:hypothetical protein